MPTEKCGKSGGALALGVALALTTLAATSGAKASDSATIDARFETDGRSLVGVATYNLTTGTDGDHDSLRFWLYPNRFREGWKGLEDHRINWIYPRGKSEGGIEILRASVEGKRVVGSEMRILPFTRPGSDGPTEDLLLELPIPPRMDLENQIQVRLEFRVTIPARRGRFGRYGDVGALGGGWYPMPALIGADGQGAVSPLEVSLTLDAPANRGVVAGGKVFPMSEATRKIHVTETAADFALVLLKKMESFTSSAKGTRITWVTARHQPTQPGWTGQGPPARSRNGIPGGFKTQGHMDRVGRATRVSSQVLEAHMEMGGEAPKDILMVEIPALDRLVQISGTTILVSDRIWELVPVRRAREFHDAALARAVATSLALPHAYAVETMEEAEMVADIVGVATLKRWREIARARRRSMGDLVGFASFIPYVDNLLYAPQIPFERAYSISIEEPDGQRDEIWRFCNDLPGGRRILAKLEDLVGEPAASAMSSRWLSGTDHFDSLLQNSLGAFAHRFKDQWWGQYPRVQYSLEEKRSERIQDGTFTHTVTIRRYGAKIVEPVEVQLEDRSGMAATLVWDGRGDQGTLTWQSDGRLRSVHVDPRGRLVESERLSDGHPLADNRYPMEMRPPLLTQLLIWGDTVTLEPFIQVSLLLARKYDISNSVNLYGMYTPRKVGGALGYLRHFGRTVTLNSKSFYAGPYFSVFHHREASVDEPTIPDRNLYTATLATWSMLVGMGDRKFALDPRSGKAFSLSLGYGAGGSSDGRAVQNGFISFRGGGNWSPAPGHNFAMYGGAEGRIGTAPASSLATLSHREILRGFDLDETYGQASLHGVIEYRHNIFGSTPITFPLGTSLDRVQGVLFAGAGTVSWPGRYSGLFSDERIFCEAGYGLRFFLLTFGVVPYLLAVDFAVPIYPIDRIYEVENSTGGTQKVRRAPFRLVFGITQTF